MTKLLKDLPVGAKVKDSGTSFGGRTIVWQIVDKNHRDYPENSATLISEKILTNKRVDSSTAVYKNTEIRKWLSSSTGFLKEFSEDFKKAILDTSIVVKSSESFNDKVFLASSTEVGGDSREGPEGYRFSFFSSDSSRVAKNLSGKADHWWLRTSRSLQYNNGCNLIFPEGYQDSDSITSSYGIRPLCNIGDTTLVEDTPVSGVYEIVWNKPPTKPGSFTLPSKITSRTATTISWSKSTDPENDPISYKLERSLDSGAFVQRYKGSLTSYKDIIEETGHTSVVYRVTAIDSNGNQSESLTSASIPVSDNTIPSIETASADLGKITAAFSVSYKVVDPDEGQTWTVTEKLDGKVLKSFSAKLGTSYTCKLSASDWQKVLNGNHILKIEVKDSEGGSSSKTISFEKAVTKIGFELEKSALQGIDKMPERAILSMGASIPAGASVKIEITNNGLDSSPTWQDCTSQVLGNEKIFFSNKTKTAEKWAVNVKVTGDKKTATEVLSISSIGGFYD